MLERWKTWRRCNWMNRTVLPYCAKHLEISITISPKLPESIGYFAVVARVAYLPWQPENLRIGCLASEVLRCNGV